MIKEKTINIKVIETDDKCKECKKDWTKCGRCLVMMKWLKERKVRIRNDQKRKRQL